MRSVGSLKIKNITSLLKYHTNQAQLFTLLYSELHWDGTVSQVWQLPVSYRGSLIFSAMAVYVGFVKNKIQLWQVCLWVLPSCF